MSLIQTEPIARNVAPGQYLGYSLQQVRLCHYLLRVPDSDRVSLEYRDDVAVHRGNGGLVLEQCKSSLGRNPVSDRSEALWKTFANWADLCASGEIEPSQTEFILYVTPVNAGNIVTALNEASSDTAVRDMLARIKTLSKSKGSSGSTPFIGHFLELGDDLCCQVISRFRLLADNDPVESIRTSLRALLPVAVLDEFCSAAIGMARNRVEKLMREGQEPIVSASGFRREFQAFVRKYNFNDTLISRAPEPPQAHVSTILSIAPLFVRQLRVVEATQDMLVTAVSDYLKTEADKIYWADEGLVFKDSFDELDQQLIRQHRIGRDEVEDTMAHLDVKRRGRELYRKCTSTTLPLEGRTVPTHFISGEFNHLANVKRVGWHPAHQTLFAND